MVLKMLRRHTSFINLLTWYSKRGICLPYLILVWDPVSCTENNANYFNCYKKAGKSFNG